MTLTEVHAKTCPHCGASNKGMSCTCDYSHDELAPGTLMVCKKCSIILMIEEDRIRELTEEDFDRIYENDPKLYVASLMASLVASCERKKRAAKWN